MDNVVLSELPCNHFIGSFEPHPTYPGAYVGQSGGHAFTLYPATTGDGQPRLALSLIAKGVERPASIKLEFGK